MSGVLGAIRLPSFGGDTFGSNAGGRPPSQKAGERPIAFALEVNGAIVAEVVLALRPEDLQRRDTSRALVHHTLGGAFVDNFGPGLPTITISGQTGWRGGADGNGETRWKNLRDTVFNAWHARRREAVQAGRDPSTVKLIYSDTLNDFTVEVVPLSLDLKRSRSSPLRISYTVQMVVVDSNRDQLAFLRGGKGKGVGTTGGLFASVLNAINRIRSAIQGVTRWINSTIVAPVRAFLGLASGIFQATIGIVRDIRDLAGSILVIPTMIAHAGMTMFRTFAAVASIPALIRAQIMAVGSAFADVWCFLLRSRSARRAYADYNPFYGASNCSSISGGRPVSPLAGTNAWTALPAPATIRGLSASSDAQAALLAIASSDPALRPLGEPMLATHLGTINRGLRMESAA